MDLFREWSKDVAKKVESAVDEVVKEVDHVSASVNAVQQPVVQTKVVSRIDIKTADRNELIQFIKDQNQHLNRLQQANKQCEQRIVQLEEQKLQHLELINTLNEDLKHSNEELKMNIEGTKKLVLENQNQKTILENSRKLALENEELKRLVEKLTIAAEKASADLLQPTSAYGGYGSVKKIGVNIQDVIYGGYGSYGSVNSISSQEKKEITRNPRRRKKKEKKRKSKPKAPSSEPDIFEEIELQETLDSQMNSCPLPEETKDIQEAREIQDNDEALSQSELQIEKNQGLDGDSHVSNEFPETESIESQESEAVHTINRENEQSKTKFKKAKEALAAKRQSLRLERSASQSPKKEEEKAIQTESNEASPSIDPQNSDQVGTSEPKVEQIQPDDSPVETKTSHLPKEADRNPQYPNRLAQRKPSNAIATHEESQESDDDSQYDEESDDDESDDDESDSEDSYETDSEDEIFNRKSYVTQRKAPVYSHAQEQVNNQIVQQSLQQKQQLRIQEQQIQQLKDDKQQLLEEIQEQHRQLEEVMSQHQGQKNLQRQLIEASNTISELERLKNREKKHSEDLEKQVEELKSKIEEINEQFNSYRRRAQALIEQNETSYGIEGTELLPTNEEKNIYLDRLKEMEQENASLKELYSEEQTNSKNKISLLEQKNEKIRSKLKENQSLVKKLEGELTTSKEEAEKAITALKFNYEKEQVNESAKYEEQYRLLKEKLNNVKTNSFNQLREKELKITQLQDTLEMKNEEYLKILREREKEKEQQNVFLPSKINSPNPLVIEHPVPLKPTIVANNKQLESLTNGTKSEETDEDNFLAFVEFQAKKEKEIQKALEGLEHYKSLHAETEATNALLLEQLSTLKQEIRKIDQKAPINLDLVRATFINYLCSNNNEELYSTLAGLLNLTQAERQAITSARKSANGWRLW